MFYLIVYFFVGYGFNISTVRVPLYSMYRIVLHFVAKMQNICDGASFYKKRYNNRSCDNIGIC